MLQVVPLNMLVRPEKAHCVCLYLSTCWSDQRRLTVSVCTSQHAGQTREGSLCLSVPLNMLVRPEKAHCVCLYLSTCWSDQRRLTVSVCTSQHAGQTREGSLCLSVPLNMLVRPEKAHCVCLYLSTCWSDQRRLTVSVLGCTTQHAGQTREDSLCLFQVVPLNMLTKLEKMMEEMNAHHNADLVSFAYLGLNHRLRQWLICPANVCTGLR